MWGRTLKTQYKVYWVTDELKKVGVVSVYALIFTLIQLINQSPCTDNQFQNTANSQHHYVHAVNSH